MTPKRLGGLLLIGSALLLLLGGGKGCDLPFVPGPVPAPVVNAPFKTTTPALAFFYDADPNALKALQAAHPGIADMLTSRAEGTLRKAVEAKGGQWRNIDKESLPPIYDDPWVQDAYTVWKAGGAKFPWIMAAGPMGSGFSLPPPETQAEAVKLWEAVK